MAIQKRNSELADIMLPDFVTHNNIQYQYGDLISRFQALPSLIGLWYGGNYQRSTGDMPNLAPYISGASSQDLSYNGNPTFNYLTNGVGYADLDGTGDYFSVADNTDLDIQGNEAQVANPGFTMGGWFWFDDIAPGAGTLLMGKGANAGNDSYYIWQAATGEIDIFITSTGADYISLPGAGISVEQDKWVYLVARYIPSTELKIFANNQTLNQTVGVQASLFNSTAAFYIGRYGANYINGRFSVGFICIGAHSNAIIKSTYQQTRSLYGV